MDHTVPSFVARVSARIASLHPSPVNQLIKAVQRPGMISFANGMPPQSALPGITVGEIPRTFLQYGSSEGDAELRAQIAADVSAQGLACGPGQVIVLSGSQQGIDLVAKLFLDPGTPMAVEAPSYVAALQVFQFFGARFSVVSSELPDAGLATAPLPVLAYVTPNFRNPDSALMDSAGRARVAEACDRLGVTLFEDDPYHALAYESCDRTPVCARLKRASWIYQGSFSKSLAPGLRLGYLVASPDLLPWLSELKGGADLHTSRVSQWLVLEQLRRPDRAAQLAAVVASYRVKRDHFATLLQTHFEGLADWQVPAGGLFFWLTLKVPCDTRVLVERAIERGVAFMPGEPFYAEPPQACGRIRLNFTHSTAEQAERGLAILGALVREHLAACTP